MFGDEDALDDLLDGAVLPLDALVEEPTHVGGFEVGPVVDLAPVPEEREQR